MIHAEDFNPVQNNPFERVGCPLNWIWKRIGTTNNRKKIPSERISKRDHNPAKICTDKEKDKA
jgi:hypothetical protein